MNVFFDQLQLLHSCEAAAAEIFNHLLYENLGSRRARGDTDVNASFEPLCLNITRVGDQMRREDARGVEHRLMVRIGGAAAASDRQRKGAGHQANILLRGIPSEQSRVLPEILVNADVVLVGIDG